MALLALIAIAVAVTAIFQRPDAHFLSKHGDIGTIDFIQYWSSRQLLLRGENPYDPALLYEVERAQGLPDPVPIMMWNPPWLVMLLSPALAFDFLTSCAVWLGVSIVLIAIAGVLAARTYVPGVRPEPIVVAAMFLFEPHLSSIRFGQLGVLYAVCVAAFLWGARRNDAMTMGLSLVPLTVKPHLFYLAFVFLAYWVLVERKWKVVLWAAVGFGVLLASTELSYPHAIARWLEALGTRPPMHWAVGTLVGIVRTIVFSLTDEVVQWPLVVIPGITTAAFVAWLAIVRPDPDVVWRLPAVLGLSLFTAPYGWLFDQAQLVVIQVGLVALVSRPGTRPGVRRPVLLALALVQIVTELQNVLGFRDHRWFFWSSITMAILWIVSLRRIGIADPLAGTAYPRPAPS
jgi:hypothetical protein